MLGAQKNSQKVYKISPVLKHNRRRAQTQVFRCSKNNKFTLV